MLPDLLILMVSDFATIEEVVGIVPRKVNEPPTRLLKKSGGVW